MTDNLQSFFETKPIPVNWHLWSACNYDCKFCFSRTFRSCGGDLSFADSKKILEKIVKMNVQKISFTGGEPFLCTFLGEIIQETKKYDVTTMIVTNGYLITEEFLDKFHSCIDWIGISLDSSRESVEKNLGRGFGDHVKTVRKAVDLISKYGIKLKINTVVTSYNFEEDMSEIITDLSPQRWKVFQFLPVERENDKYSAELSISQEQFNRFKKTHKHLNPIFEENELMKESYLMIDPLGRFFQNTKGLLEFSDSILEIEAFEALEQVGWNRKKFLKRGGIYKWR